MTEPRITLTPADLKRAGKLATAPAISPAPVPVSNKRTRTRYRLVAIDGEIRCLPKVGSFEQAPASDVQFLRSLGFKKRDRFAYTLPATLKNYERITYRCLDRDIFEVCSDYEDDYYTSIRESSVRKPIIVDADGEDHIAVIIDKACRITDEQYFDFLGGLVCAYDFFTVTDMDASFSFFPEEYTGRFDAFKTKRECREFFAFADKPECRIKLTPEFRKALRKSGLAGR